MISDGWSQEWPTEEGFYFVYGVLAFGHDPDLHILYVDADGCANPDRPIDRDEKLEQYERKDLEALEGNENPLGDWMVRRNYRPERLKWRKVQMPAAPSRL